MPESISGLKGFFSSRAGFFVPFVTLPVWILFALLGQFARGEIVWLVVTVTALLVRVRWELRGQRWFWVVLCTFALAHAPLVWWNPLQGKHVVGAVIVPFMFLDYSVLYGLVFLTGKLTGKPSRS
jgi:hypothetical protein